jgi:hypothetical protein
MQEQTPREGNLIVKDRNDSPDRWFRAVQRTLDECWWEALTRRSEQRLRRAIGRYRLHGPRIRGSATPRGGKLTANEHARRAECQLADLADRGLFRYWQRHGDGHYLIQAWTDRIVETRSVPETAALCATLWALDSESPLGRVRVSRLLGSSEGTKRLFAALDGMLGCLETPSKEQEALAQRAFDLMKLQSASADLRGSMFPCYDGHLVNSILGQLSELMDVVLVCVWEWHGGAGFGGPASFYINEGGRLCRLEGDVRTWLLGDPDDPRTPTLPEGSSTWRGRRAGFTTGDLAWNDLRRNYARNDLPW